MLKILCFKCHKFSPIDQELFDKYEYNDTEYVCLKCSSKETKAEIKNRKKREWYRADRKKNPEKYRLYYEKTKDRQKTASKDWYYANIEKVIRYRKTHKEQSKKYKEENKEKIRLYNRRYREKNKEKIARYKRQYRKDNPERIKEISRKCARKKRVYKTLLKECNND